MGRLLRILLTHFLCTQGGCNKERVRERERGGGGRGAFMHTRVCVHLKLPPAEG